MKKFLKIAGVIILLILLFLVVSPFIFKDRIAREVKVLANKSLKSEVNWTDISLSFFSHFPRLTLTLSGFYLKGSPPFSRDTLVSAKEMGFGIDLQSIFSDQVRINKVYLERGVIRILYNEKGASDFDVYQSGDTARVANTDTAKGAAIHFDDIRLTDCRLIYADASIPFELIANGVNYTGSSIYTGNIFDVTSKVTIDSLDVSYDHQLLIQKKPVTAKMNTKINSDDLSVFFEKNDLKIKDIPLQFNGKFNFEKEGYALSLTFLSVMEKEFLSARFKLVQGKRMYLAAKATASLDLEKWSRALDFRRVTLKGTCDLSLNADGYYESGPVRKGPRNEVDTVILSIPKFSLMTKLEKGYLKYPSLTQALTGIAFNLNVSCPDHDWHHINISMDQMKASFADNQIDGKLKIQNMADMPVDVNLNGRCDLSKLKEVFPIEGIDLEGIITLNVKSEGNYIPDKGSFPVTTAFISWENGKVKTNYYPSPVEQISMKTELTNRTGKMNDLVVKVDPFAFNFENQPFILRAKFLNFDDLNYDIQSDGVIDLGKVYKVFSQKGMELNGFIETHFSLKGKKSDAMAERVERLQNKGSLKLRDIAFRSEDYPKPFIIRDGNFRFEQDKIWFDRFLLNYGASDFEMKGSVKNAIAWYLSKNKKLRGDFHLNSGLVNVDEFMYFAPAEKTPAKKSVQAGVVVIPSDMDINFEATVAKVAFSGLDIRDLKGKMVMKEGILVLKDAGFNLVGCQVGMEATYGSITPQKAHFEFHLKADDFDVKRAYNEIAMVRQMASSAGKAEGIVSLDYKLKGALNADMFPVLPSVEGGGVLSVRKVKVSGLKLFSDISKSTEREGLANPDITKVEIKSTIKNQTVTFEQFKFKVAGIRFRIAGSSTFNNVVNMKIRLGLPPLGIFGIPLKVTGPMDKLKIRYGRGKDSEEAQESDYSDQLPPEMLERIKKAKDDGGDDDK